jgi:hypothetical protein
MFTTIIREFTLGGCDATCGIPSFFFQTNIIGATPCELLSIAMYVPWESRSTGRQLEPSASVFYLTASGTRLSRYIHSDGQQFTWSGSDDVCVKKKGRYPTSGVAASKCELPDDGGKHATETCRSKGGSLSTSGSHRIKTFALLLVLFSK